MIDLATTPSTTPSVEQTRESTDNPGGSSTVGYSLCEFCEPSGTANHNPDSVCGCSPIDRKVAGNYRVTEQFDLIMRIAETAVIRHWNPHYLQRDSVIASSIVSGRCNDEYRVIIELEESIWENLQDSFKCEFGTARITRFRPDGCIGVGVTLTDDSADTDAQSE